MLEYALLVSYPGEMPVLGSVKVVVLELWSTKYGIPSLVCLISQPEGRGVSEPTILKNNKTKIWTRQQIDLQTTVDVHSIQICSTNLHSEKHMKSCWKVTQKQEGYFHLLVKKICECIEQSFSFF